MKIKNHFPNESSLKKMARNWYTSRDRISQYLSMLSSKS